MGRVVHFEIHADDPQRAIAFYTELFGWSVQEWAGNEYWLVSTGPDGEPGINGAIMPRRGDRPAVGVPIVGAVITVQVDDLDAVLEGVARFGTGVALDKMVVPGVGTVAYVFDPAANVVGVLQPEA